MKALFRHVTGHWFWLFWPGRLGAVANPDCPRCAGWMKPIGGPQ